MPLVERDKARLNLAALRREVETIERRDAPRPVMTRADFERDSTPVQTVWPTGANNFDNALNGGLPTDTLVEIISAQIRDTGALTGFLVATLCLDEATAKQPVVWISTSDICREAGLIHGNGFRKIGFDPSRLMIVQTPRLADALWVAEEASCTKGIAAAVLDMRGASTAAGLRETRRLYMRARATQTAFFLLRQASNPQPTAAPLRLRIGPAPSLIDPLTKAIGPPGFNIVIDKNKAGKVGSTHILHWRHHERRFHTAHPGINTTGNTDQPHFDSCAANTHHGSASAYPVERQDYARQGGPAMAHAQ